MYPIKFPTKKNETKSDNLHFHMSFYTDLDAVQCSKEILEEKDVVCREKQEYSANKSPVVYTLVNDRKRAYLGERTITFQIELVR